MSKKQVNIKLDEFEYDQLLTLSKEHNVTVTALVRYSILNTLEKFQHTEGNK